MSFVLLLFVIGAGLLGAATSWMAWRFLTWMETRPAADLATAPAGGPSPDRATPRRTLPQLALGPRFAATAADADEADEDDAFDDLDLDAFDDLDDFDADLDAEDMPEEAPVVAAAPPPDPPAIPPEFEENLRALARGLLHLEETMADQPKVDVEGIQADVKARCDHLETRLTARADAVETATHRAVAALRSDLSSMAEAVERLAAESRAERALTPVRTGPRNPSRTLPALADLAAERPASSVFLAETPKESDESEPPRPDRTEPPKEAAAGASAVEAPGEDSLPATLDQRARLLGEAIRAQVEESKAPPRPQILMGPGAPPKPRAAATQKGSAA